MASFPSIEISFATGLTRQLTRLDFCVLSVLSRLEELIMQHPYLPMGEVRGNRKKQLVRDKGTNLLNGM